MEELTGSLLLKYSREQANETLEDGRELWPNSFYPWTMWGSRETNLRHQRCLSPTKKKSHIDYKSRLPVIVSVSSVYIVILGKYFGDIVLASVFLI